MNQALSGEQAIYEATIKPSVHSRIGAMMITIPREGKGSPRRAVPKKRFQYDCVGKLPTKCIREFEEALDRLVAENSNFREMKVSLYADGRIQEEITW